MPRAYYKVEKHKVVYQPLKQYQEKMRGNPTPAEDKMWGILEDHYGKGRVGRQILFGWYILDFVVMGRLSVIELDGSSHDDKKEYDRMRDVWIGACGLTVLRFPNSVVFDNPSHILQSVDSQPTHHIEKYKSALRTAYKRRQESQREAMEQVGMGYNHAGKLVPLAEVEAERALDIIAEEEASKTIFVTVPKGRWVDENGRRLRPRCPNCGRGIARHWTTCQGCHATIVR
jgi:very-short-patch-repair endonuclease